MRYFLEKKALHTSNSQINSQGHHLNTILSNLRHTFGLHYEYWSRMLNISQHYLPQRSWSVNFFIIKSFKLQNAEQNFWNIKNNFTFEIDENNCILAFRYFPYPGSFRVFIFISRGLSSERCSENYVRSCTSSLDFFRNIFVHSFTIIRYFYF